MSFLTGARTNFQATVDRLNKALSSRVALAVLAAVAATLYVLVYVSTPDLQWLAWWGWWDQSQYVKCAAALANLQLGPDTYWYPLGYPLAGALFYKLAPHYALFIPNLLFTTGSIVMLYLIARRLVTPVEGLLLLAVFLVSYRGTLGNVWIYPWNTIPTQFFAYIVIYNTCFTNVKLRGLYWSAGLVGLNYLCRPADALCLMPLLAAGLMGLESWRLRLRAAGVMALVVAAFVVCVLLVNYRVFGSYDTPYDRNNARIGLFGYPVLWKLYLLAIDSNPVFREPHPMLFEHMPWLWLVPTGVLCLLRRFPISAIGLSLSICATFALYLNYNDLWPGNLYHYHLIHYFAWAFPVLGLMVYVGLRDALKTRFGRTSLAAASVAAFLASRCYLTEVKFHQAETLPNGAINFDGDFLFFPEAKSPPVVSTNGNILAPPYGVILVPRPDGYAVLPRRDTLRKGFAVRGDSPDKPVMVAKLRWVFRFR